MSRSTTRERYDLLIDGEHVEPSSGEYRETVDPATGEAFAEVAVADAADVDSAVAAASSAFPDWRDTDPVERGRTLYRVADRIREHVDELADVESRDQGKPRSQARSDLTSAARYFEYYAGAADKLEGRSVPVGTGQVDFTVREPYGVSAQIIPWNFPGNLFARGVAPALAAGNTAVVKPAPTTPLSAYRLAELCFEAGVPESAVNVVSGGGETGAALTGHADVDTITFTGSVTTGQQVMEAAAGNITPVTLELGGKNPAIVYPDADVEEAVSWVDQGIFTNAGQVCSAADRAIVHEDHYEEFLERIVERANAYDLGPGADDPDMGPLNSEQHFERVRDYVEVGVEERDARGGRRGARPGRLLLRADGPRGRRQRHAGRPGGDFRARPQRHPVRRRRGPDRNRQRRGLRPRRGRVHQRRASRSPRRAAARSRERLRQQVVRGHEPDAVRRVQEVRHRPREGPGGAGLVPAVEERRGQPRVR
nr:aldehyde dehydrogenase family protein [Halobacterium bonnevillei]